MTRNIKVKQGSYIVASVHVDQTKLQQELPSNITAIRERLGTEPCRSETKDIEENW